MKKQVLSIFLAAMMGLVAVILPVWLTPMERYDAVLFSIVRTGIEGMNRYGVIFLFLAGIILGIYFAKPLLTGLSTMLLFPVLAMIEMGVDSTSHKLWPIEFIIYFLTAFIAIAGAFLGNSLRMLVQS